VRIYVTRFRMMVKSTTKPEFPTTAADEVLLLRRNLLCAFASVHRRTSPSAQPCRGCAAPVGKFALGPRIVAGTELGWSPRQEPCCFFGHDPRRRGYQS